MTANPEQHVDISALQDLKEIMESEFETLINTFVADSSAKVGELAAAIASGDTDNLRTIAHSLKGSSSNICAGELTELARQLEFLGKSETLDGAEAVLEKLKAEFAAVQAILQQNL